MRFVSQYRHDKREFEAEIRSIERAHYPSLRSKEGEAYQNELAEMMGETEYARRMLEGLETWQVEKKAKKWGITIEPSLYSAICIAYNPRPPVLGHDARTKVLRLVRDARRENLKWWVTVVVVPTFTLLIGLTGAIIGVLAFLTKK